MQRPTKPEFLLGLLCAALVLGNLSCTEKPSEESTGELNASTRLLYQAADDYWEYLLEESLYLRLKAGLRIKKLPDISYAYAKTQQEKAAAVMDEITTPVALPEELTAKRASDSIAPQGGIAPGLHQKPE